MKMRAALSLACVSAILLRGWAQSGLGTVDAEALLTEIDGLYEQGLRSCDPAQREAMKREREKVRKVLERLRKGEAGTNSSLDTFLSDVDAFARSKAYVVMTPDERTRLQELRRWAVKERSLPLERRGRNVPAFATNAVSGCESFPFWATDGLVKSLTRGDLVFRRDNGMWSEKLASLSMRDKRFSHAGIVAETGDDPVLVHAGGDDLVGSRGVSRIRLEDFLSASVDAAVYRLSANERTRNGVAACAEKRLGKQFDPAFDLKTKDRLYCMELVRDCVNEAVGRELIGTSKKGDFEYVAVDDCYRNGMTKVWDSRDAKTTEKRPVLRPQTRLAATDNRSTTNAPARKIIRFIPKNGGSR